MANAGCISSRVRRVDALRCPPRGAPRPGLTGYRWLDHRQPTVRIPPVQDECAKLCARSSRGVNASRLLVRPWRKNTKCAAKVSLGLWIIPSSKSNNDLSQIHPRRARRGSWPPGCAARRTRSRATSDRWVGVPPLGGEDRLKPGLQRVKFRRTRYRSWPGRGTLGQLYHGQTFGKCPRTAIGCNRLQTTRSGPGIVGGVCEKRGMIQELCRGSPIFTHTALAEGERAGGTDDIRFRISG